MTKKTKEEKKIADYRRKLKFLHQSTETEITDGAKQADVISKSEAKVKTSDFTGNQSKREFFIKDLKKSLLIIFLIITLEIVIYFARIKDYLKLGY